MLNRTYHPTKTGTIQTHRVEVEGGELAVFEEGAGNAVIFLHGGPGDTHHYMRRMAVPLASSFRCIYFDQRGTGQSAAFKRVAENFRIDVLINDLTAVTKSLGLHRPILIGHSWGAMYGLYAMISKPHAFAKAALISMGPLTSAFETATTERLLAPFSEREREQWNDLRAQRTEARKAGDKTQVENCDRQMMHLRVKSWVFDPAKRDSFLEEYFADPPCDRQINALIWDHASHWLDWDRFRSLSAPIWLCSGREDSVPPEQAFQIAKQTDLATVAILDRCGHMPWLDQPELFYSGLNRFLAGDTA